jgi:hypothetical protein
MGEHIIEAASARVPSTVAHRDELWDRCHQNLTAQICHRLEQEVLRLGGSYAHVLDESIDSGCDDVTGRNRKALELRLDRLGTTSNSRSTRYSLNALQRLSLVNCNVIGFVTLDNVLRFVFRSMVQIAFEAHGRDNFLQDHSANSSCFGLPFNMVAALERLRHRTRPILHE